VSPVIVGPARGLGPPPAGAVPLRRWVARLLDWVLVLGVSSLIWPLSIRFATRHAVSSAYEAPVAGMVGFVDDGWAGAGRSLVGQVGGLIDGVVAIVIGTLALQVLAVAGYDVVCHRVWGRTLGKLVTGLVVCSWSVAPGGRPLVRRVGTAAALGRTLLTVVLPGTAWILLVAAVLTVRPLLAVAGIVVLLASVGESAVLRGSVLGLRCAHDRWTRTAVLPAGPRALPR
jgi:hypothetical protein